VREVTYLEAWRLWRSGQSTSDLMLWGHAMLWWGRAGKLAQFAGELDYRLCCMPRTMRISRTPPSTWAVPSATKPCLR